MHQTFYIDVDEEISSVIDRLNKSMSTDNYFVVPKRALFLQSIVNLKILKREADKLAKRVIIVTQDEIGASMAERSDVEVRESLEGLEPTSDIFKGEEEEIVQTEEIEQIVPVSPQKTLDYRTADKQVRLSGVGSSEYFAPLQDMDLPQKKGNANSRQAVLNAHKQTSSKTAINKQAAKKQEIEKVAHLKKANSLIVNKVANNKKIVAKRNGALPYQNTLDPHKEKALEKMFATESYTEEISAHGGSGKTKKIFLGFIFLCLFMFAGALAYLFVPSAKVVVVPNVAIKKVDLDINGTTENLSNQNTIAIRVFSEDQQIALPYDLSSQTVVTGQKAQGNVVIYNEYSDAPQTLLATTRLQTDDGKIFHIVKNVVVPGYTNTGGQIKPGSVQADIVADQAGSDFNVDPTNFKIPGFEGGPKYDKFYATSSEAMKGGTTDNSQSGVGIVVQSDLDSAKQKAENAFKDKINQDIASQLQAGEVAMPQAQDVVIAKSTAAAKVGDKVSSFNYNVQGSVRVLIFSENDVKKDIEQSIQNDPEIKNATTKIAKVEYGSIDPDFDGQKFDLKVHGEVSVTPNIDLAQLKKDLLGKSDDQLADVMRQYPAVKNANVEFQPSFVTRIPQYPQRVSMEIKSDGQ